jgi:hydrogenase maturation protease
MTDHPSRDDLTGRAAPPAVAVVGVGNEIMGDDGLGPAMIRRLEESLLASAEDVRLANAGTTGFLALEAMSGADRAVVIDAISTGADPGGVQEYRCVDGTFQGTVPDVTMHDISFTEALVAGRDVYDLPEEIRILGVEPASVTPGVGLTEQVADALTDVAGLVIDELETADADLLAAVVESAQGETSRSTNGHAPGAPRDRVLETVRKTDPTMLETNRDAGPTPVHHPENEP